MIGRFQAMLPFTLHRVVDAEMGTWTTTADGYEVTIHPPQQAVVSREDLSEMSVAPLVETMRQVRPNPSPKTATGVELDGKGAARSTSSACLTTATIAPIAAVPVYRNPPETWPSRLSASTSTPAPCR